MAAIPVFPGARIRQSARLEPHTYRVADPGGGALVVEGDDITLDFGGATLSGAPERAAPDTFAGIGLVSYGNSRLTIRNARIRGFKTAIHVQGGADIVIENCDLSDNYAAHLGSTPEREDPADWMWPHHNDQNEWMTNYGASLYVEECTRVEVRRNRGRRSQNGILLDEISEANVYDNDFSFQSGWGLAMWRSCRNTISRNRFDWCVRGYSHGVYWRGQDSAGILVFEQCSDNVFALNSATHGGDGFFLYAGNQTLRETGEGGCNRNLLYGNDFSHAVANGIEATFSDSNRFIANILNDCQHGIWGGYSYRTTIARNTVRDCAGVGIAIEHGSDNTIEDNDFGGNPVAIRLWWNDNPDLMGGVYGSKQNTDSERNLIARNRFLRDRVAIHLIDTQTTRIEANRIVGCLEDVRLEGDCRGSESSANAQTNAVWAAGDSERGELAPMPPVPGTQDAFLPADMPRGRQHIVIGAWGPVEPVRQSDADV